MATFKLSENGLLELFYKEDGRSLYCLRKRSANICLCQYFYPVEEDKYRCPYDRIPFEDIIEKEE
jgi:hypothetical protein